ncbi:hypothetical protein NLU13_5048 [Sarocladium strictum]|uniref:Major facilitator superfamily (MFS) profile domain-containing protein n=1 Tax=Sarocladium strictum TaxID=5046 RepID=A0AA39L9E2_SARSR|nr:hypothetical protein NLU13_5048 [Sarocladium strictum]
MKENATVLQAEDGLKVHTEDDLPSPEAVIEALGIPNWRDLEKKAVRRLDMTLMPCMWSLYLFNYLDRASLSQGRLSSLDADLGLTGYQFSTAVAILSVGYVLGQIPSNMILPYIRPSLYLPACAILWSGVSAATCGVKDYSGLVAVRFCLGIVEAPLFPGAIYVMSCWYTRKEIGLRVAVFYLANILAQGTSGLIAAAVFGTLEGALGMAGWQWLFIVLASVGAALAVVCIFLLPDYPDSTTGSGTWVLTEEMRIVCKARMVADRVSATEAKAGLWLIVGMNIFISMAYGFSNFYPSIVRGFGYERTTTLLITFPPYFCAAVAAVCLARSSDHFSERGWHFSLPIAVGLVGYVVCLAREDRIPRYIASFLYITGMLAANPLINSWIPTCLGRTPEKRAVGVALNNVLGQIGTFVGPYFFDSNDEPAYTRAFALMLVSGVLAIGCGLLQKFLLRRENKKLYQKALQDGTAYSPYVL